MSETNTINPISPQEMTNHYVKTVKDMILDLTDKPLEVFLDMQANKGLVKSYKNWKEDLFNQNEGVCLNANQIQAIIDAFNSLNNFVEKKEGEALSKDIKQAKNVTDIMTLPPDQTEETERNDPIDASYLRRLAAETKSDLPPPAYSRFDPNPNRKGGKRKTRRRRKLKKRKTMKKKRLRRKKTMKKRKSRKRRKTKKRRSKRR